jgi:restriction system protein
MMDALFTWFHSPRFLLIAFAGISCSPLIIPMIRKLRGKHTPLHKKYRRMARKSLRVCYEIQEPAQRMMYLKSVSPYVFEEMILTNLRKHGYLIKRNKKYSGDGGIDGRYKKSRFQGWRLIQAKCYSGSVSRQHLVEFEKVCTKNRTRGIFIHTGRTPKHPGILKTSYVQIISGGKLLSFFSKPGSSDLSVIGLEQ